VVYGGPQEHEGSALRILIVDQEYLVAMEAERILQDAGYAQTHIAMAWQLKNVFRDERFDLVMIDATIASAEECRSLILASGAGLVLLSFRMNDFDGIADWAGAPVVPKPFEDERVLQAVKDAAGFRAASLSVDQV
jgi:DNA-binding response OmpR family regulator